MIIGIAGPYSDPDNEKKARNFAAINEVAAKVFELGHIPFIGLNMALPVVANLNREEVCHEIMDISMAVIDQCDALLVIGESPGANRERDLILSKGLPVYYTISEIPEVKKQ